MSKTADIGQFQFFLFLLEEPCQPLDELASIGRGEIDRIVFQEQSNRPGVAGGKVLLDLGRPAHAGIVLGKFGEQSVTERRVVPCAPRSKGSHQQHAAKPDSAGEPDQYRGQPVPPGLHRVAADPASDRIVGRHPPRSTTATGTRSAWPERPPIGQPQQCRRERQRRSQYDSQAEGDPHAGLPELAELGEDHHSDPAHHGAGTGRQRSSHPRECLFQRHNDWRRGVRLGRLRIQFLAISGDQEKAIIHSGPVTQYGHIDFDPPEQIHDPPLSTQLQQAHGNLNGHHDSHQRDHRNHRGAIEHHQQDHHQDNRPELGCFGTVITGPQHVTSNRRLATGRHPQPLLDDARIQSRLLPCGQVT